MVNLKTFHLGPGLRYPITITKLLKNKGAEVAKRDGLVQYTFKFTRTVGDPELGEERTIEETGYGDWDCPTDGTLLEWHVKEGDVVSRDQLLIGIDEPCPHSTQWGGLCSMCGKDMKEANWAAETLDTDRASIAMVHDNVALKVSPTEAARKELELQQHLLQQRKLSLVVDLDQTIIHACIDPTVGIWQRDPTNPNYEAVKDVRSFQLDDGPKDGEKEPCWYYIKLRPGLAGFLRRISEIFELHVYTMGTRAYAQEIAKIVDPDMKLFGNRIISRDENGSMTAKSLQRLFPVSTNMAVVIDDRADVWPRNRSNLIKVTPYDFFKGIGDINSSFLPKREDLVAPAATAVPAQPNGDASGSPDATGEANNIPALETPVANDNDENTLLQLQAEEQERALEKQLKERPLLHLQEELDKEDAVAEGSPDNCQTPEQNGHSQSPPPQHRHNLLRDDDQELTYLEEHLTGLHRTYYKQYSARIASQRGRGNLGDVTPEDRVPDVGKVMEIMKGRVLRGCNIVLSGLFPIGTDVYRSELGVQLLTFGADLRTRISDSVTHLVVSSARPRTQKVQQAARIPNIKIVNQDWLLASIAQWRQVEVEPYQIEIRAADRMGSIPLGEGEKESASTSPPRLKITLPAPGRQSHALPTENGNDDGPVDESGPEDDSDSNSDSDGEVHDNFGVMPTELQDGERSPVDELKKIDWGEMDADFKEFMHEEGLDTDSDSESDTASRLDLADYVAASQEPDTDSENGAAKSRKRRMGESDGDDNEGSILAKKQKLAKERTTGLRNVKNAGEEDAEGSGLPTPIGTGDEEDVVMGGGGDDEFDLEAELEAELDAGDEDG
ncbi:RNA polymerase II subunit A C-terminal domain phosphatase [Xylariales sp. AK1849]|nr:RNA polymerase II subunit A C-terminal domain phosphatase [Xylariales sp. AK1849]